MMAFRAFWLTTVALALTTVSSGTFFDGFKTDEHSESYWESEVSMNSLDIQLAAACNGTDCTKFIEEIQEYLKMGNELIKRTEESNIVIVVGNTGVGKSTLVQFTANSSNTLRAECKWEECILFDDSETIGDDLVSYTFVPNLVEDAETFGILTPFYDMSGFNNNRNISVEVANAFFMREVLAIAEAVKIVIIAKHTDLNILGEHNFKDLMQHLAKLIKNPANFTGSISMIVNMAPYASMPEDLYGEYEEYLQSFTAKIDTIIDQDLKENVKILTSALLEKTEQGKLKNVELFRTPVEDGYLIHDIKFQECKENLVTLIWNNSQFSVKSKNEFSISLSSDAKLVLKNVTANINLNITSQLLQFSDLLQNNLLEKLLSILEGDDLDTLEISTQTENFLTEEYTFADTDGLSIAQYLDNVTNALSSFSDESIYTNFTSSLNDSKLFLEFIEQADQSILIEPICWVEPLKDGKIKMTEVLGNVTEIANVKITEVMSEYVIDLLEYILTRLSDIESENENSRMEFASRIFNLLNADYGFADIVSKLPSFYTNSMADVISTFDPDVFDALMPKILGTMTLFDCVYNATNNVNFDVKKLISYLNMAEKAVFAALIELGNGNNCKVQNLLTSYSNTLSINMTEYVEYIAQAESEVDPSTSNQVFRFLKTDFSVLKMTEKLPKESVDTIIEMLASFSGADGVEVRNELVLCSNLFAFVNHSDVTIVVSPSNWVVGLVLLQTEITQKIEVYKSIHGQRIHENTLTLASEVADTFCLIFEEINSENFQNLTQLMLQVRNLTTTSYPISQIPYLSPITYVNEIISNVQAFADQNVQKNLKKISKSGQILYNMMTLSEKTNNLVNPITWVSPLLGIQNTVVAKTSQSSFLSIMLKVAYHFSGLGDIVVQSVSENVALLNDAEDKRIQLSSAVSVAKTILSSIQQTLQYETSLNAFLSKSLAEIYVWKVSPPIEWILLHRKFSQAIEIFETLGTYQWKTAADWTAYPVSLLNSLTQQFQTLSFLSFLFEDLSTASVQLVDEYDLKKWKSLNPVISNLNFDKFWTKFSEAGINAVVRSDKNIISDYFSKTSYDDLNTVFHFALTIKDACTLTNGNTIILQDNYVSISSALQCFKRKGTAEVTKIMLFGWEKAFFDMEFNVLELTTAPKIKLFVLSYGFETVLGLPKILLNGADGLAIIPKKHPGQNGEDGRNGERGGDASDFIGVCSECNKLPEIFHCGGRGGDGQDGADGGGYGGFGGKGGEGGTLFLLNVTKNDPAQYLGFPGSDGNAGVDGITGVRSNSNQKNISDTQDKCSQIVDYGYSLTEFRPNIKTFSQIGRRKLNQFVFNKWTSFFAKLENTPMPPTTVRTTTTTTTTPRTKPSTTTFPSTTAIPPVELLQEYNIRSVSDDIRNVDIINSRANNGTVVQAWTKDWENCTNNAQVFRFKQVEATGYLIESILEPRWKFAISGHDPDKLGFPIIWEHTSTNYSDSQVWNFVAVPAFPQYYTILNHSTGKSLRLTQNECYPNGKCIHLVTANSTDVAQWWEFIKC